MRVHHHHDRNLICSCNSRRPVHHAHCNASPWSETCLRAHLPLQCGRGYSRGVRAQVVFPPQPRQFNGFTLDEETIEFVPLGWFELRVRRGGNPVDIPAKIASESQRAVYSLADEDLRAAIELRGDSCPTLQSSLTKTVATWPKDTLFPGRIATASRPCVVHPGWQGYDKGREKFIYQARQSSLAGREFGDGVLNARRVDSATMRRNRSASASSYHLPADLGVANLRSGLRPAR